MRLNYFPPSLKHLYKASNQFRHALINQAVVKAAATTGGAEQPLGVADMAAVASATDAHSRAMLMSAYLRDKADVLSPVEWMRGLELHSRFCNERDKAVERLGLAGTAQEAEDPITAAMRGVRRGDDAEVAEPATGG